MRKPISLVLAALLLVSAPPRAAARTSLTQEDFYAIVGTHSVNNDIPTYRRYQSLYPPHRPAAPVVVEASDYVRYEEDGQSAEPERLTDYEGMPGVSVLTGEAALIEYDVTVPEAGFYDVLLEYYPVEGKSSAIQRSLFIDGNLPYRELSLFEMSRIWQNRQAAGQAPGGPVSLTWERDNQGNDLKPAMIESPDWISAYVYDSGGYVTRPLSLYLEKGTHTLSLLSLREPMLLRRILLQNEYAAPDYRAAKAAWDAAGAEDTAGRMVVIEAEDAVRTSSQMLYPVQDQSSPSVSPSSPRLLLNNTVGGHAWRLTGQWIEWDFTVPETGYYELTLRAKQNFKRGIYASRRLSLNGEVPFSELEDYGFHYAQNWRTDRIGGDTPYKFYLEAGVTHTLRMEAVLGEFSEIISAVRDAVYDLNAIYRKVIARTSVKPDRYADYQLERTLPALTGEMTAVRDSLTRVIDGLRQAAGGSSERERVLVTMRDQLDVLIKDNERFPRMVESFKVNVRACGTWLNEAVNQPLQIDTLFFHSPDTPVRVGRSTIFHTIAYEISRLYYSFVIDYNQVGNIADAGDENTITLWIGSGRDQAGVIKSLIDETFARQNGVNVNVRLVDMSTLLQASLAGQGPDVAIQVPGELPMNFGLRGSVADLRGFEGFEEVRARFAESAMMPYEFGGASYALPETQIFPMMFYRKDILSELDIGLPDTWDDVAVLMSELSFNHMEFGMLPSEQVFTMLLYQNGGQYYNENATRSALDREEAVNAFKRYTEFYTDYKLDRETSVEERFRTGETPIIIADYTFYNNLQVSAPDLKGIWGFAPVPGTRRADGTVDRSVASNGSTAAAAMAATTMIGVMGGNGSACVMMEDSPKKEQVWKFMQWWTSAQTQVLFGREMESLMGPAARVPTANREAFAMLPWPVEDYRALREQFQYVRGIPQVPGGYFTYRNVNNAFYSVTTPLTDRPAGQKQTAMPREELMDKVILINDEIRYKRTEFGLPLEPLYNP
ncbi:MAG: extracellular solute-binding protein [Oscillospiraceae bacterium]|nr:extracellular solute-binding protein [Oscillospiraceae bacterium]